MTNNTTNVSSTAANRPTWGSYSAFLLAAVGSSIGLGNVWKFPYELGVHNGGTFLYVYIGCVLLVAFPLIMAELMIGRLGRGNPVQSIRNIVSQERLSGLWQIIGWLGILTSFLIFSYYSVVGSWILFYIMQSLTGAFVGVPAEIVQNSFGALLHNSDQLLIWHSVFVLMVVSVLAQDMRTGLERAVRVLMPLFLGFLIWLTTYASQVGDFERAYDFMFSFNVEHISAKLVVSALTQALFSLSIGIGILIMYGSYLQQNRPLFIGAGAIMLFDTSIAMLMGLTIFSIVFAFGMQADSGPGLIFETLPVAFSQMTDNSSMWSAAFFILLLVAALTSAFALLEPFIALLVSRLKISRRLAAWLAGGLAWISGLLSVYSFSDLRFSFYYFDSELQHGFFDLLNILTTHVMLPITALLIAIFAGWCLPDVNAKEVLNVRPYLAYRLWRFCIRFVAPFIISLVLLIVLFFPS